MSFFNKISAILFQTALVFSLVSCASTTRIEALNSKGRIDNEVKIYVEGQSVGAGSALYSDSSPRTAFTAKAVQLRKEGCQTRREELKTKINIVKFIGGLAAAIGGGGLAGYWSIVPPADSLILNVSLLGAVIVAAFLPTLWTNDYKPLHSYDFHCVKTE